MIVKFDGLDGCGKSTMSRAVASVLAEKGHSVAVVGEFWSPVVHVDGSTEATPMPTMRIRETVLDPDFDCDDVERQLLLHFLSRRRNRVDIPYLRALNDFVIVDRSTISNYAYAAALEPDLSMLSRMVLEGVESADIIFWIDTPVDECLKRISESRDDAVERKGRRYFERVQEGFETQASLQERIYRLDGRAEVGVLVSEVATHIEASNGP